jgi:ABC-type multidrug transport system fused ATPase/permease subunit
MPMTQEKYKKLLQWGTVGLVALIVSPIIFSVVKGLIGLAIAALVGGVIFALMPAVTEKLAQLKFQAMKGVISRAPIESLYQRAKERWAALQEQQSILHEQAASLEEFKKKAEKFAKQYPDEAETWLTQLVGYEKLFAYRVDQYKAAKRSMEEFNKVVEKAEAIYEMAMADAKLGKSFNKDKDFMAVFREKTAFDAVDKASSQALANLRMALVDDEFVSKQIEGQQTHAITYDAAGHVVLGNILQTQAIPVR